MENNSKEPQEEEEVTPETVEHMNRVFLEAQKLLTSFNNQSNQVRGEIVGLFKTYNESAAEMIPESQIRNIMQEYEAGMKEVRRENLELEGTLEKEFLQRQSLVEEMTKSLAKLDILEERLRKKMEKKKKEQSESNRPAEQTAQTAEAKKASTATLYLQGVDHQAAAGKSQ